jgi:hypothetical protein
LVATSGTGTDTRLAGATGEGVLSAALGGLDARLAAGDVTDAAPEDAGGAGGALAGGGASGAGAAGTGGAAGDIVSEGAGDVSGAAGSDGRSTGWSIRATGRRGGTEGRFSAVRISSAVRGPHTSISNLVAAASSLATRSGRPGRWVSAGARSTGAVSSEALCPTEALSPTETLSPTKALSEEAGAGEAGAGPGPAGRSRGAEL